MHASKMRDNTVLRKCCHIVNLLHTCESLQPKPDFTHMPSSILLHQSLHATRLRTTVGTRIGGRQESGLVRPPHRGMLTNKDGPRYPTMLMTEGGTVTDILPAHSRRIFDHGCRT
jgi:hypothetical protein